MHLQNNENKLKVVKIGNHGINMDSNVPGIKKSNNIIRYKNVMYCNCMVFINIGIIKETLPMYF